MNSTPQWLHNLKWIGWDLDGTLYPTPSTLAAAVNKKKIEIVAHHLGCSIEKAQAKFDVVISRVKSNTLALNELGLDGERFFLEVWDHFNLIGNISPDPKLVSLFSQVTRVSHAILTNSNTQEHIAKKLARIGLPPQVFALRLTSVDMGYGKPNPRVFETLLEKTTQNPQTLVYVGDREDVDLAPAKKLGIRTVLISDKISPIADLTVPTPHAFLRMLL